jgi:hypothetical protein
MSSITLSETFVALQQTQRQNIINVYCPRLTRQILMKFKILWTWGGQLSRYIIWLLTGRSGDRIQGEARFSAPVQTGPGVHSASCTMGIG